MRKLIFGINLTIDGCCDFAGLMRDAAVLLYDISLPEGLTLVESTVLPSGCVALRYVKQ